MSVSNTVKISFIFIILLAVSLFPASFKAYAQESFKPVIIYTGAPDDGAFNQGLHDGVLRFNRISKSPCKEVVASYDYGEYVQSVKKYIHEGYSPIVLPYSNEFPGLEEIIRKNNSVRFIAIDFEMDLPNLFTFRFSDHEGSFLAGTLAAIQSKSNIIGYIGATSQPTVERFYCGYFQGAKYINPEIEILHEVMGRSEGVWYNQPLAYKLAVRQIEAGADVLYAAAGNAGLGVLKAAADKNVYSIGVDHNQNALHPGSVIGSMVKRVDQAVFAALMLMQEGIFRDTVKRLGLSQKAVGIAFDKNTAKVVSPDVEQRIDKIKNAILLGKIQVNDYLDSMRCNTEP